MTQKRAQMSQLILANDSLVNKVWGDIADYLRAISTFHPDILLDFGEVFVPVRSGYFQARPHRRLLVPPQPGILGCKLWVDGQVWGLDDGSQAHSVDSLSVYSVFPEG